MNVRERSGKMKKGGAVKPGAAKNGFGMKKGGKVPGKSSKYGVGSMKGGTPAPMEGPVGGMKKGGGIKGC